MHAFKDIDTGEIHVKMNKTEKGGQKIYKLIVSDNGTGIPSGIDPESVQSLGMRIIRVIAHQLRGTLKVETGKGTTFVIEFPA
jgi:two-component sensor histidine kinase